MTLRERTQVQRRRCWILCWQRSGRESTPRWCDVIGDFVVDLDSYLLVYFKAIVNNLGSSSGGG